MNIFPFRLQLILGHPALFILDGAATACAQDVTEVIDVNGNHFIANKSIC